MNEVNNDMVPEWNINLVDSDGRPVNGYYGYFLPDRKFSNTDLQALFERMGLKTRYARWYTTFNKQGLSVPDRANHNYCVGFEYGEAAGREFFEQFMRFFQFEEVLMTCRFGRMHMEFTFKPEFEERILAFARGETETW